MKRILAALVCVSIFLGGCGGGRTRAQVISKAAQAKTKEQLRTAIGEPDDYYNTETMGALIVVWKYKTSDGEVVFELFNGDAVSLRK